jgi:single-stranded DNA-binding protein
MIDALIAGKLHGSPAKKTAKNGKPFVTAKARVHAGETDVFVSVVAFNEPACKALLALGDGDAVSMAGSVTLKAWSDKDGNPRPAVDLVASQVLTTYHVTKKRKAVNDEPQTQRPHRASDDLDDGSPLDF